MMSRNLLKNTSGTEDLKFWDVTSNGGDGWKVEKLPIECGFITDNGEDKYFVTSFELCLKKQVIDLQAEGYSTHDLDAQPAVTVKDWYSGWFSGSKGAWCGCIYHLTVQLLDGNKKVLQEFKPEPVTLDAEHEYMSWREVSHTFSNYGPGLRYISFEHGGKDTKFWKGSYGVRVTRSSVTLKP
ncbi:hypothetical protein UPYG_G00128070 [Umbra pygmaea]|uniref:FBA domain-containing protein n=1 Tax=Umbra pygmaea TaxID=75934 RepID=A0ABD0XTX8_UMBPY